MEEFRALAVKQGDKPCKGPNYITHEEVKALGFTMTSVINRTPLMTECEPAYRTNFQNNIVVHAYERVFHCVRKQYPDKNGAKTAKKEINNLFKETGATKPDLRIFKKEAYKDLNFYKRRSKSWTFVAFFLKIQKDMKSFNLSPVYSAGLEHIFTNAGIHALLSGVERQSLNGKTPKQCTDVDAQKNFWDIVFTLPLRIKRKFAFAITTNGVTRFHHVCQAW